MVVPVWNAVGAAPGRVRALALAAAAAGLLLGAPGPAKSATPVVALATTASAVAADASGFYLATGWSTATRHVLFGGAGDVPLAGDWDGDGVDTLGVRRGQTYYLTDRPTAGTADRVVSYGRVGDDVVVGDWDGDGRDTLGVRRGNTFYLTDSPSGGSVSRVVAFGRPTDDVVVGDWDGDGRDTLGVRRLNRFYLTDAVSGGSDVRVVAFGSVVDVPLVGDWDGNGTDTLGVRRGTQFHVSDSTTAASTTRVLSLGRTTDQALVGDWDGAGGDTLGVRRYAPGPYRSAVRTVSTSELGGSWRPGCPVGASGLRNVSVTFWGYDMYPRTGNLVVAASEASRIAAVFSDLYSQRFPVHKMYPTSLYGASDDLSMQADDTSAFLCRAVPGSTTTSQHAYGLALDVNPLVNPWVRSGRVDPPEGRPYVDRRTVAPGLIRPGDAVVRAFAARGWSWGGYWTSSTDYQHFSRSGR